MFCEQLLRKANERKAEIIEGRGDPWVTRQQLRELYQQLLVTDLEFALDKKVEQDLWNHAFKNQISALQRKAKDKMNPKRSEVQAMLTLFLDSGSGFYLQLLQEVCCSFKLDIPCCVRAPRLGMQSDQRVPVSGGQHKVATPECCSILYICQHCLVHLGDLARYRNETNQSESYYLQAAHLVPSNGQPYNQLAIVAASKADQLAMTFYYIRSIAVKHPFPAAATNLQTTFSKLVDRDEVKLFKMKEIELIHFFIKFHAIIYLAVGDQDLQIASAIKEKLEENFRSHLSQETLTAQQLVQIASINLFALYCVFMRQQETAEGGAVTTETVKGSGEIQEGCYAADETRSWNLVFGLTMTLLQLMLHYTPGKSEGKPLQWCGLPAVKVILDWVVYQPSLFQDPFMSAKSVMWGKLARVLNSIQSDVKSLPKYSKVPLPEDVSLNEFLPLQEIHSSVEFTAFNQQPLTEETQQAERAKRLVAHGKWVAQKYPDHLKAEPANEGAAKVTFTSQSGEEQTRRQHHQKQKQPKTPSQQQQQQRQNKHQQSTVSVRDGGQRAKKVQVREGPQKRDSSTEPAIGERERGVKSSGAPKGNDGNTENKTHSVAIQAILPRPSQTSSTETTTRSTEPIPIPGNSRSLAADGKGPQDHTPVHSPAQTQGRQHPYQSPTHSPSSGFRHPVGQPMRHHPPPSWPNHPQYPQHGPPHPHSYPRGHPPTHQQGPRPPHQGGPPPHLQQGLPPSHQQGPSQGATPHHPPQAHPQGPPPSLPSGPHQQGMPPHIHPPQGPRPNFPGAPIRQRPGYPPGEITPPMWQQKHDGPSGYEFGHQQPPHAPQSHPPGKTGMWPTGPTSSSTADASRASQGWGGGNQIPSQNRGQTGRQNPIHMGGRDGSQIQQQPYIHLDQAMPPHLGIQKDQEIQEHGSGAKMDPFQMQKQQQEHSAQQALQKSFPPPPNQPHQDMELTLESMKMAQQLMSQNTLSQNILELLSTLNKQIQQSSEVPADASSSMQSFLEQQIGSGNTLDTQSLALLSQLAQQSASIPDTPSQRFLGSSLNKEQFAARKQPSPVQKPFQSSFPGSRNFNAQDQPSPRFVGDENHPYRSPQHIAYPQLSPEHKTQVYPSSFEEQTSLFRSSPSQLQQQQQQRIQPDWSIDDGSDGRGTPTSPPTLFPTNEEVSKMKNVPGFSTWPDQFSVCPMDDYQPQRTREVPKLLSPASSNSSLGLASTPSSQPSLQTTPTFLGPQGYGSTPSNNRRYDNGGSSLFSDSSERKSSLEDSTLGSSSGYSLFSYSSPWAGGNKEGGHNLTPSPFSSSPSSPRSQSPSVQGGQMMSKNLGGLGGGLGWGGERGATAWSNPALGNQLSSSPTSGLLPDSIQSIWATPLGSSSSHKPSPLEELLKRQQMTDQR
ncbi:uncharacterized protein [Asterias amurensis]|uniref:uncharacterized protein n=1 Tax=Asterias amurensis TaxID=7602 RepID=UPI003AB17F44